MSSQLPRIGLTTLFHERPGNAGNWFVRPDKYDEAVVDAGGLPISIPAFVPDEILDRYLDLIDGMLFIGGPDIPPSFYGQTPHPSVKPLPDFVARNHFALIRKVFARNIPLLGVCLGMQELNTANGGSLIQDLGKLTEMHRCEVGDQYHGAVIEPCSRLAAIFGAGEIRVNSKHHQALDPAAIAPNAHITARCGEVVEAIEFDGDIFRVGVQWHPERIDDDIHRRKLFGAFLAECTKR